MICSEKLSTQYIYTYLPNQWIAIFACFDWLPYPWIFTVLRTERKMAHRFAKVLEEEIEEAFFYPYLVNTKATNPPPPQGR